MFFPVNSLVIPEDTGDMILAAQRHGAATDLMDEAIWTPVSMTPEGAPVAHLWERWLHQDAWLGREPIEQEVGGR